MPLFVVAFSCICTTTGCAQIARQLNVRFEERLAERTRIAQELHDTLLQGFLSASMQLHVTADCLPDESPAKAPLGRILELMARVIEEGRNAVRGLRSSQDSLDLEQAFSKSSKRSRRRRILLSVSLSRGFTQPASAGSRRGISNRPRSMLNAFRHSRASPVEVHLGYTGHLLRVRVRDNGCGIDPRVLRSGRDGHWDFRACGSGPRESAPSLMFGAAQLAAQRFSYRCQGTVPSRVLPQSALFYRFPGLGRSTRRGD